MAEHAVSRRSTAKQRRSAILKAAADLFFEQGYSATSIDAIIERVGGSKRNVYNEFGSKEGLFTALVTDTADRALIALEPDRSGERSLGETLRDFGRQLLIVYMSPASIGVLRTIMAEATRFPELTQAFYETGPGRSSARLTEVLEAAKSSGEITVADCPKAADNFMGMLRDNLHLQVMLGLKPRPDEREIDLIVQTVVDIFLHGVCRRQ
ncbi:MAG: TetR/AcrR family transcriptional regulator [Rhodobacteraceae bacterium]|nr:TetR/AcrR family transcriptional regulator [Paracoccaceae bacterium]